MGLLDKKVAIVTGAGRGIGRATAIMLAKHGATVVVNDPGVQMDGSRPSHAEADGVVKEIVSAGGKASADYSDVSDFRQVERMAAETVRRHGRLDILVNNAGTARRKLIWEMAEEDWDKVLDVHLKGTFNCTRNALPPMRAQRWGRIVNTLSPAGIMQGSPRRGNYGAAKGGIYAFTNTLAAELAGSGVTANVICPASAETRLLTTSIEEALKGEAAGEISPEAAAFIKSIKPTPPEDVAVVTAYLCTEEAADITGKVLYADGPVIKTIQPLTFKPLLSKEGHWSVEELVQAMRGKKNLT